MHTHARESSCARAASVQTDHTATEKVLLSTPFRRRASPLILGIMVLGLAVLPLVATTRYNIGSGSLATSTCSAHFNTPCAIRTTHEVVCLECSYRTPRDAFQGVLEELNPPTADADVSGKPLFSTAQGERPLETLLIRSRRPLTPLG